MSRSGALRFGMDSACATANAAGILFDLDGTLADTVPVCYAGFRGALEQHAGRTYTDAEIDALFGPNEMGSFQRVVPDRWEACYATFLTEYEAAHALCREPFPEMVALLEELRQSGIRV